MRYPVFGVLSICLVVWAAGPSAFERGAEALRRRDFGTAEAALQQAIREQPANATAHKLLGLTYSGQEKYALAEEPFRRACELNRKEESACYYLGRLYYTLNKYIDSKSAFGIALQQTNQQRGRVLLGLALTLEALGENEL